MLLTRPMKPRCNTQRFHAGNSSPNHQLRWGSCGRSLPDFPSISHEQKALGVASSWCAEPIIQRLVGRRAFPLAGFKLRSPSSHPCLTSANSYNPDIAVRCPFYHCSSWVRSSYHIDRTSQGISLVVFSIMTIASPLDCGSFSQLTTTSTESWDKTHQHPPGNRPHGRASELKR